MKRVKRLLSRKFPGVFDAITLLGGSPLMRKVEGARTRRLLQETLETCRPFYIDVCSRTGFGAMLSQVLMVHDFLGSHSAFRRVVSSNALYSDELGRDVLSCFLVRKAELDSLKSEVKEVRIPFRYPLDLSLNPLASDLTVQGAHDLFHDCYAIRPQFVEEARGFVEGRFEKAIGVHFRGSDKRLEAPRLDWAEIGQQVDECREVTGIEDIFVAADEAEFVTWMKRRYGAGHVHSLECEHLAKDGVGAHFGPGSGFGKGREALLTMLVLSMCRVCIRGASHLSGWAKILNPQLPIVMIGKPYSVNFLEREIMKEAATSAVQLRF